MAKRNSTVKIVNGKVVFSQEIIDYFENLRTVENSEWIDEYFEYLGDESNLTATKYRKHHIIPCFVFKDEIHKNRKTTLPLADAINGNIIKLSISNHIKAHNCLRFIFPNNKDARYAVQQLCGEEKYQDTLTEKEINEIAKIEEDCAKENQTKEELKEWYKKWYNDNKNDILKKNRERNKRNKEKYSQSAKKYRENNKEKIANGNKKYREENKEKISKRKKEWYKSNKKKISKKRKQYRKENKEKISKQRKESYKRNKEKVLKRNKNYYNKNKKRISKKNREYSRNHKNVVSKKNKNYNSKICIDLIKGDVCSMSSIIGRKFRDKELYKNIKLSECVLKFKPYEQHVPLILIKSLSMVINKR